MTKEQLEETLVGVLKYVGIDTSIMHFRVKRYSKKYAGVYHPNTTNTFVYLIKDIDENGNVIPFTMLELVYTSIHEACHAIQWHDENYKRIKGVMHDEQFYKLYNMYVSRFKNAYRMMQLRGSYNSDEEAIIKMGDSYDLSPFNSSRTTTANNISVNTIRYSSPFSDDSNCKLGRIVAALCRTSRSRISVKKPVRGDTN